jgi:hypothetical protein
LGCGGFGRSNPGCLLYGGLCAERADWAKVWGFWEWGKGGVIDMNPHIEAAFSKKLFPAIYLSAGTHITIKNQEYVLSFIRPNNTQLPIFDRSDYEVMFDRTVETVQDIFHSTSIGKKWKSILLEK